VDNLFSIGGHDPAAEPDPGSDLRRGDGPTVHTPGTDRDAVPLPPARLGPRGHTDGRSADTDGVGEDTVEPASTGAAGAGAAPRGADIARAALDAARARQAERGGTPARRTVRRGVPGDGTRRRRRGWSGAGSDDRDPQTLGRVASRLSAQRGWAPKLANGSVFGRWAELVGPEVAEHATPTALREGELTVQADSTAWATQLRLLQRQLLAKIAAGLGDGVVTRMRIHGPSAPSWRRGPRHVSGRGPRDTYG
jgi:predicted nucleic acid-binding Zn ribbon protein